MECLNITLSGQVSSGKSSLINSLIGRIVVPVSIRRSTLQAIIWSFNQGKPSSIAELYQVPGNTTSTITEESASPVVFGGSISSCLLSREFNIMDLPGINDIEDKDNNFFKFIEINKDFPHVIAYITSAESAFTLSSELEQFNKIRDIVKQLNAEGKFCELIVIINKYDYSDDPEYQKIYHQIQKYTQDLKIFRISSYQLFCQHLYLSGDIYKPDKEHNTEFRKILRQSGATMSKGKITKTENTGDIDNLLGYLSTIDIHKEEYASMMKSLEEYDIHSDNGKLIDVKIDKLFNLDPWLDSNERFMAWVIDSLKYKDIITNIQIDLICKLAQDLPNVIEEYSRKVSSDIYMTFPLLLVKCYYGKCWDMKALIKCLHKYYHNWEFQVIGNITLRIGKLLEGNGGLGKCYYYQCGGDAILKHLNYGYGYCYEHARECRPAGSCSINPSGRLLHMRSDDPYLLQIKKMIRISHRNVNNLAHIHLMKPGYFKQYFKGVENLYILLLHRISDAIIRNKVGPMHEKLFALYCIPSIDDGDLIDKSEDEFADILLND